MNENVAEQNLKNRETWKTRVALPVALVALTLSLATLALDQVMPNAPSQSQGFTARVGWYFHEGQAKADVRTLAATIRYLLEPEPNNSVALTASSVDATKSS